MTGTENDKENVSHVSIKELFIEWQDPGQIMPKMTDRAFIDERKKTVIIVGEYYDLIDDKHDDIGIEPATWGYNLGLYEHHITIIRGDYEELKEHYKNVKIIKVVPTNDIPICFHCWRELNMYEFGMFECRLHGHIEV